MRYLSNLDAFKKTSWRLCELKYKPPTLENATLDCIANIVPWRGTLLLGRYWHFIVSYENDS